MPPIGFDAVTSPRDNFGLERNREDVRLDLGPVDRSLPSNTRSDLHYVTLLRNSSDNVMLGSTMRDMSFPTMDKKE